MKPAHRPDIYGYHDYREFLRDWLAYLKAGQSRLSLRKIAREAKIAVGYLTMVLKGERGLSVAALEKLKPVLELAEAENTHLERLRTVAESDSEDTRQEAMKKLQRSLAYRRKNPKELEVYKYLTHWYYVAIREMAQLQGFRADAKWIQARLRHEVPLIDIETALKFLLDNGYLIPTADGSATAGEKRIECLGGVYRMALSQMHREVMQLAIRSIESASSEERLLVGHTLAIPESRLEELKKILSDALEAVARLETEPGKGEAVYQVNLSAFPLATVRDTVDE